MLTVGQEDPGVRALCMLCPRDGAEVVDLYVILWEWGVPKEPSHGGGCLRLCWEHLDELTRLALEVL